MSGHFWSTLDMARNKLKQILQDEGITQAQLSAKSGVSAGTINKVCNGRRPVSPTTQAKIIKALISLAGRNYDRKVVFS
jgi:transcriptional regulator with XRE-family HTH domain